MAQRRKTRAVNIAGLPIGGDAPVALQSITSAHAERLDQPIAEISNLCAGR